MNALFEMLNIAKQVKHELLMETTSAECQKRHITHKDENIFLTSSLPVRLIKPKSKELFGHQADSEIEYWKANFTQFPTLHKVKRLLFMWLKRALMLLAA